MTGQGVTPSRNGQRFKAFLYSGAVCGAHACAYRRDLRIKDRQADAMAREEGWRTRRGEWVCPTCAAERGA